MKRAILGSILAIGCTVVLPGQNVQDRRQDQQNRIANGIDSGQLTAGEAAKLEGKEQKLNQEIAADRAADGGKLTPAERAKINRQQNRLSKQIYQDNHNGAVAHYGTGEVGQRRENQQDRIAQGLRSGSISAGEAAHLEQGEQALNHELAADRAANGGKLTAAERAQVNRQQNRLSKRIYRAKH